MKLSFLECFTKCQEKDILEMLHTMLLKLEADPSPSLAVPDTWRHYPVHDLLIVRAINIRRAGSPARIALPGTRGASRP